MNALMRNHFESLLLGHCGHSRSLLPRSPQRPLVKPLATRQFTAYVGIDWADTKHDVCLQVSNELREFDCLLRDPAAVPAVYYRATA